MQNGHGVLNVTLASLKGMYYFKWLQFPLCNNNVHKQMYFYPLHECIKKILSSECIF